MNLRKVGWEDMDWIHQGDVRAGRIIHKGCSPPRNFTFMLSFIVIDFFLITNQTH